MYPASFEYHRAATVEEAVGLLTRYKDDAKLLAGGHSLIPMMKLRLAQPKHLIDIGRVGGLSGIKEEGGSFVIGALTTHFAVESSAAVQKKCPMLSEAAALIGDPQVRNYGTVGGSVAHSDPAADWPAVLLALGAEIKAVGPKGARTVKIDDFFKDLFTTALGPDEILTEIRIPKMGSAGWSFQKFNRRAQDWAIVGVAAWRNNGDSGVALVNMGSTPVLASAVSAALAGGASPAEAAEQAAADASPQADLNASVEFRVHLAKVLVRRALEEASA
jgi:carbon-monoxide dehydrogenase medium subunit